MTNLNTLMHERVDGELPDLDALTSGAIRDGGRLRRRRRATYAGAALALTVIAGGGAATLGSTLSSPPDRLQPGSSSTVPADGTPVPSAYAGPAEVISLSPVARDPSGATRLPRRESAPFRIALGGWTCGAAADEKLTCSGTGGRTAQVTWRPESGYADWTSGSADKTADWISTVHDGVFVTIEAGTGTGAGAARALGAALTWK